MAESLAIRLHRLWVMDRRIRVLASNAAVLLPEHIRGLLDVGAGSGDMALAVLQHRPELHITGVDVLVRPHTAIAVQSYDGLHLPHSDASVDAVMLMDVLHHCDDPVAVLRECLRVARVGILLKDHIANNAFQHRVLTWMDWVGNKGHHVALPNNYLSSQAWRAALQSTGLQVVAAQHDLPLYPWPLAALLGGTLHNFWWLERLPPESAHA